MGLMHQPTGTTLFVAVYWVTYAATLSVVTAGVIFGPYYLAPYLRRLYRWLRARRSHRH